MGEAKRRGTFEERQLQAKDVEAARMLQRARELAAAQERQRRRDEAHPEEAAARRARSRQLNTLLARLDRAIEYWNP